MADIEANIDRFIDHEKGKSTSKKSTIQHRRSHLKGFNNWVLEHHDGDIISMGAVHIEDHLSWMGREDEGKSYAPKTIRARWWAIKAFYSYLNKRDYTDVRLDQVNFKDYGGSQPKRNALNEAEDEHYYLTFDEVEQLIENVPSPKPRNELVVRLLFETGMRAGELANTKVENIDFESRDILIQSLKKRKKVVHRTVHWWSDGATQLLKQWIDGGQRAGYIHAADSPYLIPTTKREKIRVEDINTVVHQAAVNADLQQEQYTDRAGRSQWLITSHTLRHSCAVHLLNEGVPVTHVKKLLGHSKLEITQQYTEPSDSDVGRAIDRMAANMASD